MFKTSNIQLGNNNILFCRVQLLTHLKNQFDYMGTFINNQSMSPNKALFVCFLFPLIFKLQLGLKQ